LHPKLLPAIEYCVSDVRGKSVCILDLIQETNKLEHDQHKRVYFLIARSNHDLHIPSNWQDIANILRITYDPITNIVILGDIMYTSAKYRGTALCQYTIQNFLQYIKTNIVCAAFDCHIVVQKNNIKAIEVYTKSGAVELSETHDSILLCIKVQ